MASEMISFRLSNSDLDWLREQCQPGESLNLAAKRLLLSISQGVDSVDSRVDSVDSRVDSRVDSVDSRVDRTVDSVDSRVDRTVDSRVDRTVDSVDTPDIREELKELQARLDERFEELEERLGKLKA